MKSIISKQNSSILLIEVNDSLLVNFESSLKKEQFIKTHKPNTYTLLNNCAIVKLYIVIDTEGTGWSITKRGVTFEEAEEIIKHYL